MEMTEEKSPPTPERGFFYSWESAKPKGCFPQKELPPPPSRLFSRLILGWERLPHCSRPEAGGQKKRQSGFACGSGIMAKALGKIWKEN
jgi:hypothetical protein